MIGTDTETSRWIILASNLKGDHLFDIEYDQERGSGKKFEITKHFGYFLSVAGRRSREGFYIV